MPQEQLRSPLVSLFGCTFALAAVLVFFARFVFFKRDRIAG